MKPVAARLRMYNVGFGDCLLLTLSYPRAKRHVLIDFGSTLPAQAITQLAIARDVARETNGQLDAIVATHRHEDHVGGFATRKDGRGAGDVVAALHPRVVVQPWTEAPPAALSAPARTMQSGLHSAHAVVGASHETRRAVNNLAKMGAAGIAEYVHAGQRATALAKVLPGVEVTVLGPALPTARANRMQDAQDYWRFQARAGALTLPGEGLPFEAARGPVPARLRWIMRQMDAARGRHVRDVRGAVDAAENDTSLILLLRVGNTRLLFPGDAQTETWASILQDARIRRELSQVDVYKVGGHGSLAATPKALWTNFARRRHGLITLLSTKASRPTKKVPHPTLLQALRDESTLHATVGKRGRSLAAPWVDVDVPLT